MHKEIVHVLPCLLISCATHEGAFRSFRSLEQERIHMRSSTKPTWFSHAAYREISKGRDFAEMCASPVGNAWKCKMRGWHTNGHPVCWRKNDYMVELMPMWGMIKYYKKYHNLIECRLLVTKGRHHLHSSRLPKSFYVQLIRELIWTVFMQK